MLVTSLLANGGSQRPTLAEVTRPGEDGSPPLLTPGPTELAIIHRCDYLIIKHNIREIGEKPLASKIFGYQMQELDLRSKEIKHRILHDRIKATPDLNDSLITEAARKWWIKRNLDALTHEEQDLFDEVLSNSISIYVYIVQVYMCI